MPYRGGHYYNFGRSYACIYYSSMWFPGGGGDVNDPLRNEITYAYLSLFGRYGEQAGVEGYAYAWLFGTGRQSFGSITEMVRAGGDRNIGGSGEWNDVQRFGRHTGMSTGTCAILGCTDPAASNYNRNATREDGSCTYPSPYADINANPTAIMRGGSSQLTWSISNATSAFISNVGSVSTGSSGSVTISPFSTTTYTLSVSGRGGSASDSVTVYVYTPPIVTLTLDNNVINRGQSTTLRWSTTGDASTLNISPGIGGTNLTSFSTVSPTQTTTYTAYASGLGGTDSDQITLTVLQPPSLSLSGPLLIYYGNSFNISYTATNTTSINGVIRYDFLDGSYDEDIIYPAVNSNILPVNNIPWGVFGPYSIRVVMTAYGDGNLTNTKVITIPIEIDETPAVIDIPQSEDKVRDEEPVITPDAEITTEQILIDDIDIPVEIKAAYPIQVEIDNNGTWINVRQM